MIFIKSVAIASAMLLSTVFAWADPVGSYDVKGANPSGSTYSGTVKVERTGQTYRVTWDVGSQTYVGTGIGSKDFIAVSYHAGNQGGLALYSQDAKGNWTGVWTYADGRQIGTESWTEQ